MTTEEKARAYAENRLRTKYPDMSPSRHKAVALFDTYDMEQAYEDGATEALASQWVSVEDRLPKPHEEVLTYTIGAIDENAVAYHDGEYWYTTNGEHIRPHYWLPIPPLKGGDA